VGSLLELESGSNDPMAVFLTVGLLRLLEDPGAPVASLVPLFLLQMTVGAAVGFAIAWAAVAVINRVRLEYDGLYPVITLAVVLLTYGVTALLGGSGFLAVYLAGLRMGSSDFVHKRRLVGFHDAIAWLSQISMFLVLGLLVFPSRLPDIAVRGLAVAAVLVVVARPLAVFVTLAGSRLLTREKLLVSWVGLRGAVPIVLATFPLVEGVPEAETLFDVVFFAVVVSVLVQGTTIPAFARRLGFPPRWRTRAPTPSRRCRRHRATPPCTRSQWPPTPAPQAARSSTSGCPKGRCWCCSTATTTSWCRRGRRCSGPATRCSSWPTPRACGRRRRSVEGNGSDA
jgi:cell volume regulation protein A